MTSLPVAALTPAKHDACDFTFKTVFLKPESNRVQLHSLKIERNSTWNILFERSCRLATTIEGGESADAERFSFFKFRFVLIGE